MPLSLKTKLKTWAAALRAYDKDDFETALELFSVWILRPGVALPHPLVHTAYPKVIHHPLESRSHPCRSGRARGGCREVHRGNAARSVLGCCVRHYHAPDLSLIVNGGAATSNAVCLTSCWGATTLRTAIFEKRCVIFAIIRLCAFVPHISWEAQLIRP
jgi:hypothetical protein